MKTTHVAFKTLNITNPNVLGDRQTTSYKSNNANPVPSDANVSHFQLIKFTQIGHFHSFHNLSIHFQGDWDTFHITQIASLKKIYILV